MNGYLFESCAPDFFRRSYCGRSSAKGKSAGLSGAISGGAEHLFGKTKARGMELVLQRVTVGLAAGFFIMAILAAVFID